MKNIFLFVAFLLITQTTFARDSYQNYLYSLNLVSKLFSKITENPGLIAHSPDRAKFRDMAVIFNKKVVTLIVNKNSLINILSKKGFSDHRFPNSVRIIQQNVTDLNKILMDNRPIIDALRIPNFTTAEIYDKLNFRSYENDELLRQIKKTHSKAFKRKIIDNLTQSIVILNECKGKVAALYAEAK
jgi:nitrous oxide reductase